MVRVFFLKDGITMREVHHRIETIEHFIERIRKGDTPARLTWPAFVVDEAGKPVTREERERILREHGIEATLEHEPDVWEFASKLK